MAVKYPARSLRVAPARPATVTLDDFRGGLNLVDAEPEVPLNCLIDALNFTVNEDGKLAGRYLCPAVASAVSPGGTVNNFFYSAVLDTFFVQTDDAGTFRIRKGNANGMAAWSNVATVTTSARGAFCDFQGYVVYCHPVDGVFTYDGTTWTSRNAAVDGNAIAVWQNKVWVAGDPADPTILRWSNAGDATTWTTASDFVRVREGGDRLITALGAGPGMDSEGRGGLLVFKSHSVHRVNSATTGAYTTLALDAGAGSHLSVVTVGGWTCFAGRRGIWRTDGVGPPEYVSQRVEPLLKETTGDLALIAGRYRDTAVFLIPTSFFAGGSVNCLQYSPTEGWMMPHRIASSGASRFLTHYTKNGDRLYGIDSLNNPAFEMFQRGSANADYDDVSPEYYAQTGWVRLGDKMTSFGDIRLVGQASAANSVTVEAWTDFDPEAQGFYTPGRTATVDLSSTGRVDIARAKVYCNGRALSVRVEDITSAPSGGVNIYRAGKAFGTAARNGPPITISAIEIDARPLEFT